MRTLKELENVKVKDMTKEEQDLVTKSACAKLEAEFAEGFEDDDICEYCGCDGSDEADPIAERTIKSPTVGVPDQTGRFHLTCVARAEKSWLEDAVERAERKAGWDPNP